MTRIYAPPEAAPTKRGRTSGRTFRGLLCEKPRQHSLHLKEAVGFCFALSGPQGTEEGFVRGHFSLLNGGFASSSRGNRDPPSTLSLSGEVKRFTISIQRGNHGLASEAVEGTIYDFQPHTSHTHTHTLYLPNIPLSLNPSILHSISLNNSIPPTDRNPSHSRCDHHSYTLTPPQLPPTETRHPSKETKPPPKAPEYQRRQSQLENRTEPKRTSATDVLPYLRVSFCGRQWVGGLGS